MVTPPVQLYEEAPVPLNVTTVPAQTVDDGETVAPTVGIALTVIVWVAVLEQPLEVPVTVYVAVAPGVNAVPLVTPPVQLYEEAPVPLNVTAVPAQTVDDGETVAPTVGIVLTVIVCVAVLEQPLVVPVTV